MLQDPLVYLHVDMDTEDVHVPRRLISFNILENYRLLSTVIFEKFCICPANSSHSFQVKVFLFFRMLARILKMYMCKGFRFFVKVWENYRLFKLLIFETMLHMMETKQYLTSTLLPSENIINFYRLFFSFFFSSFFRILISKISFHGNYMYMVFIYVLVIFLPI
jgi:hypothetical protein